jgi:hypothetical protein
MIPSDFDQFKSTQEVKCICDYCGVGFTRKKHHIVTLRKVCPKDSCGSKGCTVAKRSESTKKLHGEDCFKDKFLKKARASNLEKYGTENPNELKEIRQKIENTNLAKYGKTSYLATEECREQAKDRAMEMYGVDHFSKAFEIKKKAQETSIQRHGDLFQRTKKWKDKIKSVCLDKYGVESVSRVEEFKKKQVRSLIERHGVDSPLKSPEIKEKARKTLKQKYGVDSALQSPELLEKMKVTCAQRYGTEYAMQNSDIKTKSMQKRLQKYGRIIANLGKTQSNMTAWINSFGFDFKPDVLILEGKELDLYDAGQKLALEFCGLYWHNENSPEPRTRSYHHDKWKRCRDKGIRLLTIFDDEWRDRNEVCKSLILSKLGVFDRRLQGRKCEVREIPKKTMKEFCDLHHLQGANKLSEVCFGLFHGEELVGAVDMGRHNRKKNPKEAVLTRLCFRPGVQVIGGANKLFKACSDWCSGNGVNKILSWSDNRYSDGSVYDRLGFKKVADLPPDYYYVDMKNPKRRFSKQSQSKKQSQCPSHLTELQWANERGLSRIWDCGKVRWEFAAI